LSSYPHLDEQFIRQLLDRKECEFIDFKSIINCSDGKHFTGLAKDFLAFANNHSYEYCYILVGVKNDASIVGSVNIGSDEATLRQKLLSKYDHPIQWSLVNVNYQNQPIQIFIIKKSKIRPVRFKDNENYTIKSTGATKHAWSKNETLIREGSGTRSWGFFDDQVLIGERAIPTPHLRLGWLQSETVCSQIYVDYGDDESKIRFQPSTKMKVRTSRVVDTLIKEFQQGKYVDIQSENKLMRPPGEMAGIMDRFRNVPSTDEYIKRSIIGEPEKLPNDIDLTISIENVGTAGSGEFDLELRAMSGLTFHRWWDKTIIYRSQTRPYHVSENGNQVISIRSSEGILHGRKKTFKLRLRYETIGSFEIKWNCAMANLQEQEHGTLLLDVEGLL
jgi:hypothetical protein